MLPHHHPVTKFWSFVFYTKHQKMFNFTVAVMQKEYSSFLSFTVTDINGTVTKLKALGVELDDPIKYEIHGR